MVLQTSGPLRFSDIRNEFGASSGSTSAIDLRNYYTNTANSYTSNTTLPTTATPFDIKNLYGTFGVPYYNNSDLNAVTNNNNYSYYNGPFTDSLQLSIIIKFMILSFFYS